MREVRYCSNRPRAVRAPWHSKRSQTPKSSRQVPGAQGPGWQDSFGASRQGTRPQGQESSELGGAEARGLDLGEARRQRQGWDWGGRGEMVELPEGAWRGTGLSLLDLNLLTQVLNPFPFYEPKYSAV